MRYGLMITNMQTTKMLSTSAFEQWLANQTATIARYREVEKSPLLAEYNTLKKIVESEDFQAKKTQLLTTKYNQTQEGKTMAKYHSMKWNISVILFNLFHKETWKEKTEVAKYLELVAQIQTPEFQKSNAFWKNPKRWYTTPESQQDNRYMALSKHADICFYNAHTQEEITELESYKLAWNDEFDGTQMAKHWESGFLYPSKDFQANHSYTSERQAYTKGQNTHVANSVLSLTTRKQSTTAPAWHPTKGLMMHPFAFTSDVWHSNIPAITSKKGVLQIKMACVGKVRHAICLVSPKSQNVLSILPSNLMQKNYVVYTLVWNEKETIWYQNNQELKREIKSLPAPPLHLLLRSYLPIDQVGSTGLLNIDWIRVYTKA